MVSFDLSVAVLFPIVVLVYCYYNFDFGREVYLTYLEMLPPGSFEHLARSFASPSKIALFRVNFDCLRISSLLDFVLRISMNLAFCYRFERVLEALVWTRHRDKIIQMLRPRAAADVLPVPKGVTVVFVAVSLIGRNRLAVNSQGNVRFGDALLRPSTMCRICPPVDAQRRELSVPHCYRYRHRTKDFRRVDEPH